MARTNAISLLAGASTPATLAEIYGLVIENVQKSTLSTSLKSQQYTGNPAAGSVEFKRFANSEAKPTAPREPPQRAIRLPFLPPL